MRRALRFLAACVVAGFAATLLIGWGSSLIDDLNGVAGASGQAVSGEVRWTVGVTKTMTGTRVVSDRKRGVDWGASQATGKPDTPRQGDVVTAWASANADGTAEWLEVDYDPPVSPVAIQVFQSFNPGAIVKVTIYGGSSGRAVVVWTGSPTPPPTTSPSGGGASAILTIPIDSAHRMPTGRVRIDLDSQAVAGWNEIDAVGLKDASGTMHWAKRARASSSYGTVSAPAAAATTSDTATPLLPAWAGLRKPSAPFADGEVDGERHVLEARGWPMRALFADATDRSPASGAMFPLRPIPVGFVVDVGVLAIASGLAWWLMTRPRQFVRESIRLRRGCCMRCGYDLQYNLAAGCSECGWRRESEIPATPARPAKPAKG